MDNILIIKLLGGHTMDQYYNPIRFDMPTMNQQPSVKKETKKSLRELEHTLKGSSGLKGNLTFANNSGDSDPESLFKGWKLSV